MDAQAIKDQVALLEEKEQELLSEDKLDTDALNATRNRLAELRLELGQQEERVQKQEAVIAEQLVLPEDYDVRTGLTGMNVEIQSLIRQALEQVTAVHNAELVEVQSQYQDKLKAANEAADTANADKSALQAHVDTLTAQMIEKDRVNSQLQLEAQDAYSKRDAAVAAKEESDAEAEKAKREAESLKKQVDELEKMVIQQKKPATQTSGLTFTSTLKPETDEERAARLKRMRDETTNRNLQERWGIPPLTIPSIPQPEVTSKQLDEAFPTGDSQPTVVQGESGVEGVPATTEAVPQAADAQAAPTLTLESLAARLDEHEKRIKTLEGQSQAPISNVA